MIHLKGCFKLQTSKPTAAVASSMQLGGCADPQGSGGLVENDDVERSLPMAYWGAQLWPHQQRGPGEGAGPAGVPLPRRTPHYSGEATYNSFAAACIRLSNTVFKVEQTPRRAQRLLRSTTNKLRQGGEAGAKYIESLKNVRIIKCLNLR